MKKKIQKAILLALCTILSLLCIRYITVLASFRNPIISVGSFTIPVLSLQGVLSAFVMLICVCMVFIDCKVGFILALIIIWGVINNNVYGIIKSHSLSPLPGLISALAFLLSIVVVFIFYRRSYRSSQTDFITGLKNRKNFLSTLETKTLLKKNFILAFLEIEDFKQLNDIYGIQAGDYILIKVSERLTQVLDEKCGIFKITGAIFAVIFENTVELEEKIKKIMQIESITFIIPDNMISSGSADHACKITLSLGLAKYPEDSSKSADLVKHADTALAFAKKSGGSRYCFYEKEMGNDEVHQKEAELLIKQAIENDWFYLVYQPQYTIKEKKLRGFETLIRCRKPDGSIVSPAYFIPAAEKTNLILKIDDYVLRRAMKEFKDVLESYNESFILSINVSAKNISSVNFVERIQRILEETNFPPNCLEIEITEYSLAESLNRTINNIQMLRVLGVQIALDDFGTGYTSIAQLLQLPINLLKIDKSLIDNIESNQMNRDLIDSVIYMGHVMNCEVISEGVETEKQLNLLSEHKCDFVQGFVWGKPMSYMDALELLKNQKL